MTSKYVTSSHAHHVTFPRVFPIVFNMLSSLILLVININQMRCLYAIYKSRDMRAKPEWQGFMNRGVGS